MSEAHLHPLPNWEQFCHSHPSESGDVAEANLADSAHTPPTPHPPPLPESALHNGSHPLVDDPAVSLSTSDDEIKEPAMGKIAQLFVWGSSCCLHVFLLFAFSLIYMSVTAEPVLPEITSLFTETDDAERFPETITQVDQWITDSSVPVKFKAPKMVELTADNREGRKIPVPKVELPRTVLEKKDVAYAPPVEESDMDEVIPGIQGNVVNTDGDVGSVDNLTMEILRHLSERKVLVVWLMDASESLKERREQVIGRFDRVYQELDELTADQPDALLTSVVAFGAQPNLMTPEPTADPDAIRKAVREIPTDESGVENVFTAIKVTALKYSKFAQKGYTVMMVVLTDESGNDFAVLDDAVMLTKRHKMPVYVMGPLAPFVRREVKVKWVDPVTTEVHYLPVERGPAAAMIELPSLPGWFQERRPQAFSSGFGAFALARIARESGGTYFVYDDGRLDGPRFDGTQMISYAPDYVTASDYLQSVERHPIRRAVMRTAVGGEQTELPRPQTEYLAAGIQFELRESQGALEKTYEFLTRAIKELQSVEKFQDEEESARWQAHYDLLMGQLLVRRVHLYNSLPLLNEMYTKPRACQDVTCNAWRMAGVSGTSLAQQVAVDKAKPPQDEPNQDEEEDPVKHDTELARVHLKRVATKHAGTPWAVLAQRELETPLKLAWRETFVDPPEGEKLPWDKPPVEWKKLSQEDREKLEKAKEKYERFQRFRREQQKKKEQKIEEAIQAQPTAKKRRVPKL